MQPPAPPPASSTAVARIMRRTGRRDTAPEREFRAALDRRGASYETDAVALPTRRRRRADVLFREAELAVFIDGCFWHACPVHRRAPKANAQWWVLKFDSIRERDAHTDGELRAAGWWVVRLWQHEDLDLAAALVLAVVGDRQARRPVHG